MRQDKVFSEIFNKYDGEAVVIDRAEEDLAVEEYQRTQDMSILEEVYIKRIPTLKIWATRFYYPGLELTIDDFMEELSIVFIKAAQRYKREKGAFNTCLYTYLNNRIKNMKNSTHAKKRRPENYDGPISGILLSLDHTYSNDKGGQEASLIDMISEGSTENKFEEATCSTNFKETVGILSGGNPVLIDAFTKLGEGSTLSSILREAKTRTGECKLQDQDVTSYEADGEEYLKSVIVENESINTDFTLLDYDIRDRNLFYSIELKDSEEASLIKKKIKSLRKNKEVFVKKIKEQ